MLVVADGKESKRSLVCWLRMQLLKQCITYNLPYPKTKALSMLPCNPVIELCKAPFSWSNGQAVNRLQGVLADSQWAKQA